MRLLQTVSLFSLSAVLIACAGSPPSPVNGDSPPPAPTNSAAPADTASPAPTATPAPADSSNPAPADTSAAPGPSGRAVLGGYNAQDIKDPGVQAAAEKAIGLLQAKTNDPSLALGKVVSAQGQVVAGFNYRLELELTSKSGPKKATVGVFRDLKGGHVLTSVEGL